MRRPSVSFILMGGTELRGKRKEDIALDDVGSSGRLREYGEQLAELIDWEAILEGTDEEFRIDYANTLFPQYAKETI